MTTARTTARTTRRAGTGPRTCAGIGALGLALALGGALPAQAAPLPGVALASSDAGPGLAASASALGSRISGNPLIGSGRTAASYLCTAGFPRRTANEVLGTGERTEGVVELGAVSTSNRAGPVRGRRGVTSVATIASGELVGGLVTFEGLESVSQVRRTPRGFDVRRTTEIASLRVGGLRVPLDLDDGPRTIGLPGVGTLTLNSSGRSVGKRRAVAWTEALRVDLADGTRIQLGRSRARLDARPDGVFRGGAWGSEVDAAGLAGSGRTGFAPMPCAGTRGNVRANDTVDVRVPGVLEADVTRSTVRTRRLRAGRADGRTTSRVAGVSLGGGAVTVDVARSSARVVRTARNRVVKRAARSRVVGLSVQGTDYSLPAAGEVLDIPGVAQVRTRVVSRTRRGLTVVALRVTLLEAGGAPVVVDLGVSKVFARR